MDFLSGIAVELIGGSVIAIGAWFLSKWHSARAAKKQEDARLSDAQWTLERVDGEVWTVHRDSPLDAFSLRVWEHGDELSAGKVGFAEYLDRGDLRSGQSVQVKGIHAGAEVMMDWVESAARLEAQFIVRRGEKKIVIRRRNTSRYSQ